MKPVTEAIVDFTNMDAYSVNCDLCYNNNTQMHLLGSRELIRKRIQLR
jgi:hypothetical protein